MVRILHIIRPAAGGMKQHLLDLAGGLPSDDFVVAVAGPDGDAGLSQEIEALGLKYYPVDITGPLKPGKDIKCILDLYKLIKNYKFDIIHCHGSKAGLIGRLAAWMAGSPVIIVTVHNFVVYEEVPLVKRFLFTGGEKFLSSRTTGIITVSRALKKEMTQIFGIPDHKITAIYNGIDLERFRNIPDQATLRKKYGISAHKPVVGTVARMAPQKGLAYFIDAAALLVREGCQGKFMIVGDGPLRPELEAQAARLGLADRLIFTGYQAEIIPFLKLFDVFVTPSIAEGLSITTIEAMAAGKAVVASAVGGLPELVKSEDNGLLVTPRDAQAMAKAIGTLLDRPGVCDRMGQSGMRMVKADFSKDMMVGKTADFYRYCMKKGNII